MRDIQAEVIGKERVMGKGVLDRWILCEGSWRASKPEDDSEIYTKARET